ncbi:hypothetical protein ACL7TT_19200 [Microbulbifer sp. 2304DJ12-6]
MGKGNVIDWEIAKHLAVENGDFLDSYRVGREEYPSPRTRCEYILVRS